MVKLRNKRMMTVFSVLAAGSLILAGCGKKEVHEIVVEKEPAKAEYNVAEASVGDVLLTKKLTLKYAQKDSENLNFKIEGYRIKGVYVQKGDKVKAGDLIAELDMEEAGEQYDNCLTQIDLYETEVNFLKEQKELALDQTRRMLESGETDAVAAAERDADICADYDPQIKEIEDLITYQTMRMDYYGKQVEEGRIYAGIDGTVAYVRTFSKTARSLKTQNVVTIFDSAKCSFTCADEDYSQYMEEGRKYTITLLNGTEYETVYSYNKEDKELVFELPEPDYTLSIGAKAYFNVILDERDGVLWAPKKAVHTVGDEYYVYFTDENNIRTVQYVTVGLKGDDRYEILSGIKEGDFLVIK